MCSTSCRETKPGRQARAIARDKPPLVPSIVPHPTSPSPHTELRPVTPRMLCAAHTKIGGSPPSVNCSTCSHSLTLKHATVLTEPLHRASAGDGAGASVARDRSAVTEGVMFSDWKMCPNSMLAHRLQKYAESFGKAHEVSLRAARPTARGSNSEYIPTLTAEGCTGSRFPPNAAPPATPMSVAPRWSASAALCQSSPRESPSATGRKHVRDARGSEQARRPVLATDPRADGG